MGATTKLRGVIPPLVTPLTLEGGVDVRSLSRLIGFLLESGVSGVFVLGSTGEGANLPLSLKAEVAAAAVESVGGRVPVLGGALSPSTTHAVETARMLQKAGIDAVVLTAPYYYSCTDKELEAHFKEVREAIDLPLMAYDVPAHVGLSLGLDLLFFLHEEGVIQGIKDSSGDFSRLRKLLLFRDPSLKVFVGTEEWADMALLAGADGVIPGLANVLPGEYLKVFDHASNHDVERARQAQERILKVLQLMDLLEGSFTRKALGLFKILLWHLGVIHSYTLTAPLEPLNNSEVNRLVQKAREIGFSCLS